jgi:hypothetical protein
LSAETFFRGCARREKSIDRVPVRGMETQKKKKKKKLFFGTPHPLPPRVGALQIISIFAVSSFFLTSENFSVFACFVL